MTDRGMFHKLVRTTYQMEWHLFGGINSLEPYYGLLGYLGDMSEGDALMLKISSGGGRVDVGNVIMQAIKETQGMVIANVIYPSASMASLIALSCDVLMMDEDTHLMFHAYSSGSYGKSDDLIQDVLETGRCLNASSAKIMSPFLTKTEIKKIGEGKDIYVRWDDANLQERIARHYKNYIVQNKTK